MMEYYPTQMECTDQALGVKYFTVEMFDEGSAVIKSDVCIGHPDELEEYLENIRKAFLTMFPDWAGGR